MTLDEMKKMALDGLGSVLPNERPGAAAMDHYVPGVRHIPEEQGLNETNGLDVLREPKDKAMNAVGPGAMQDLINLLVPSELSPGMLAGAGVVKPKTPMKNVPGAGMGTYNKEAMSKAIGDKLSEVPKWKQKKTHQP